MDHYKIIALLLIVVLPPVAAFLCELIHRAAAYFANRTEDEKHAQFIFEIESAVLSAVKYVNQTFVDELKKTGVFSNDEEYGKEAFEEAFNTAVTTISHDALQYVEDTYGNVRNYLSVKIEDAVQQEKKN